MGLNYFGTDGIRARVGSESMNPEFAAHLGDALVRYFQHNGITEPKLVAGRDTRESGASLLSGFIHGWRSAGGGICTNLGRVPTPLVAFETARTGAHLGLSITASHNPFSDNGFKLFQHDGSKFGTPEESVIESFLDCRKPHTSTLPADLELPTEHSETKGEYLKHLQNAFPNLSLQGMRIVVDCAHGAAWESTPAVLRTFGAQVKPVAANPTGYNINEAVGSEHPDFLRRLVIEGPYDLGIAHDGDGDRVLICDESGFVLSGEHVMALIARYSPGERVSPSNPLVTTIQSNLALDAWVESLGGDTIRTDIGDRNVSEAMRTVGACFGGENSGHFVFSHILPTGDGLIAALKVLEAMKATGLSLSQLRSGFELFPSKLVNLSVSEKRPLDQLVTLQNEQTAILNRLGKQGRVLIRYSGTEAKLRILVEAQNQSLVDESIAGLIKATQLDFRLQEA